MIYKRQYLFLLPDNFPPLMNGNSTFKVTIGQTSLYQFTVDDTDVFKVGVVGGIPTGGSLAGSQRAFTFTLTLTHVQNVSLTFFAVDSLNATSLLSVQVQVCGCQNGGNCTLRGLIGTDGSSLILNCECNKG